MPIVTNRQASCGKFCQYELRQGRFCALYLFKAQLWSVDKFCLRLNFTICFNFWLCQCSAMLASGVWITTLNHHLSLFKGLSSFSFHPLEKSREQFGMNKLHPEIHCINLLCIEWQNREMDAKSTHLSRFVTIKKWIMFMRGNQSQKTKTANATYMCYSSEALPISQLTSSPFQNSFRFLFIDKTVGTVDVQFVITGIKYVCLMGRCIQTNLI